MADVAFALGVDGCRGGWIAALGWADKSSVRGTELKRFDSIGELIEWRGESLEGPRVAVDMPIGLPERVSFRGCDRIARQRLGYPRMSAVFQPPDRELLRFREPAGSFPEVQAFIQQRREREPGANCPSKQAFYLLDKLHQLDEAIRAKPERQKWLVEFHPEVSFLKIAHQVLPPKKRSAGREARLERLVDYFPDVEEWLSKPLRWTRHEVARDDILDAYAGLWTALRVAGVLGAAEALEDGSRDGPLSMRIMV